MQEKIQGFDFRRILLPENYDWSFLGEVAMRTTIMFAILLLFFKLSGKRSIYELSLFELAIIIGLGSAAGDPMFYENVGLLPVLVVFIVIAILYRGITQLTVKSEKAEKIIEGKPVELFTDDLMIHSNLDSQAISFDEFFAYLRKDHIEHLGQIKSAFLEVNGTISVFFYPDDEVKPGLPILPESLSNCFTKIPKDGYHSCSRCGFTQVLKENDEIVCPNCNYNKWVASIDSRRIG
jgi:uncharacterized membrane protein YcaP (DUF421 family)